jgi:hypothetical protein
LTLSIAEGGVLFTQKNKEEMIKTISLPPHTVGQGRYLIFGSRRQAGESYWFYLKNASKESMICGESKSGVVGAPVL